MIYVLEDDASIRKLVVYTLQSQGMEAKGFERPSLFWQAVEEQVPQLVLLDIMLPEQDGLQILSRLRAMDPTRLAAARGRFAGRMAIPMPPSVATPAGWRRAACCCSVETSMKKTAFSGCRARRRACS